MIALGAEFLAQQLAMARRMLPVDEAAVQPGRRIRAAIRTRCPRPSASCTLMPKIASRDEECSAVPRTPRTFGTHVDRCARRRTRRMNSTSPSGPRQRSQIAIDVHVSAPPRQQREARLRACPAGRELTPATISAASTSPRCSATASKRIGRRRSRRRDRQRDGAALADIAAGRAADTSTCSRRRGQRQRQSLATDEQHQQRRSRTTTATGRTRR